MEVGRLGDFGGMPRLLHLGSSGGVSFDGLKLWLELDQYLFILAEYLTQPSFLACCNKYFILWHLSY